jgi:predicted kinase
VLDATFQKKKHRDMARILADKYNAVFLPLYCSCPDHVAKKWLKQRLKSKSVSDGRWEIYQMQKDSFDMFTDEEKPLLINTAETEYTARMNQFSSIAKRIKQDIL